MGTTRATSLFVLATAVVIAVFAGVAAVSEWWVLPAALGLYLAGSAVVLAMVRGAAREDRESAARAETGSVYEEHELSGNGTRRRETSLGR